MSTELKPVTEKIRLTRFWGGARGTCVQVTQSPNGYVQLTVAEAHKLGRLLLAFSSYPLDPNLEEE